MTKYCWLGQTVGLMRDTDTCYLGLCESDTQTETHNCSNSQLSQIEVSIPSLQLTKSLMISQLPSPQARQRRTDMMLMSKSFNFFLSDYICDLNK